MNTPDPTDQTPPAQRYYFPNDGGTTSFSCEETSLDAAQRLNQQHLKHLKEHA